MRPGYDARHSQARAKEHAMPMMDLTDPAGTLSAETKVTLANDLTTVRLRAERAPDTNFFRQITWLFVHELPADDALTAGHPAPILRLQVTVPEGALSERRKEELVREAATVVGGAA
jgi:phenylpyruvate tautomerase PptA (4-oxalocrotonate tautomerase family)